MTKFIKTYFHTGTLIGGLVATAVNFLVLIAIGNQFVFLALGINVFFALILSAFAKTIT